MSKISKSVIGMVIVLSLMCAASVTACAASNDDAMIAFCEENFAAVEAPGSFTVGEIGPMFSEGMMALMPKETAEEYKDAVKIDLSFTSAALQASSSLTESLFPNLFVLGAGQDGAVPSSVSLITTTLSSGEQSYAPAVILNGQNAPDYLLVGFAGMSDAEAGEIQSQCYLVRLDDDNQGEVLGGPYTVPES